MSEETVCKKLVAGEKETGPTEETDFSTVSSTSLSPSSFALLLT